MIVGVGIDLVSIEKLAASVQSEAFRHKVFSAEEIAACEGLVNPGEHYAGKFAAKEALMKAIGKGIRQEVWFSQIQVLNNPTGAPYLRLTGEAGRSAQALEASCIHVSITHADGMAMAVVILERE